MSAGDALRSFRSSASKADGAHAFYLGAELTKAEIALRLGKRYAQDEPLDWGVAADRPAEDRHAARRGRPTLRAKKKRRARVLPNWSRTCR